MATTITQTTLSSSCKSSDTVINVVSAANIVAPQNNVFQKIYVIDSDTVVGELMDVRGVSGNAVYVSRLGKFKSPHVGPSGNGGTGAVVLINPPPDPNYGQIYNGFQTFNPSGPGSSPQVATSLVPWINTDTGEQWLYSSVTGLWVPGWGNPRNPGVTAAVASAAGLITPSGPLFHVTGTAAVTGFNIPVGFMGGSFRIISDGVWSWTNANNIALASGTVVVGGFIDFQYDANTGKFYPGSQTV